MRDASVSCPIGRKDFMIDGGERLLVSHLCAAPAALTVITSADACTWKERLGASKVEQRSVCDFAFVHLITAMSACLLA